MSIPEFRVKEQWLGTGLLSDYTFDFTIQDPTHLELIIQDAAGLEVDRIRGDDIVFLSGIVFDAKNGGGTVSLAAALPQDYVITALLAPDEPIQPSEFRGKFNFTLELFELALDRLVCQIQRLAYWGRRSIKLHDLDDIEQFDMTLPKGAASNFGKCLIINTAGDGIDYGATLADISNAAGYASSALAARDIAITKATAAAASAVAAAASAATAACGIAVYGLPATPLDITAAGGLAAHTPQEELQVIHGSPGAVTVIANPQIAAGTTIGQRLSLQGTDDAKAVTLTNGNGLSMNGDIIIGQGDFIAFWWDGVVWQEMYRRR